MRSCLLSLFILLSIFGDCLSQTSSNEGTDFWFGFMEHRDINRNTKVAMITSKTNTSGTIEVPLTGWSENFTVAANQVTIIELPAYTESLGSERIAENAVHVISNSPVSVYIHQYLNYRSEASIIIPTVSLGAEYYSMSYNSVGSNFNLYPSEFLIVGVEDSTKISITLSDRTGMGRPQGSTFDVVVNRGETYQVQSGGFDSDLTGTHVVGDKPFAMFSGNSWTEVPTNCEARDNLLEQMHPITLLGSQYVIAPYAQVDRVLVRIMSTGANTNITVEYASGQENIYLLNAGRFAEFITEEAALITSDQPIMVGQYNMGQDCSGHSLGDPSMILLNSVEQIRDTVTLFNSSLELILENYINVITKADETDLIYFDGQPMSSQGVNWETIGDFAFTSLRVGNGAHTLYSQGCGVTASAYGYGEYESYAYSGGASFTEINANPIPEGGCFEIPISF